MEKSKGEIDVREAGHVNISWGYFVTWPCVRPRFIVSNAAEETVSGAGRCWRITARTTQIDHSPFRRSRPKCHRNLVVGVSRSIPSSISYALEILQ